MVCVIPLFVFLIFLLLFNIYSCTHIHTKKHAREAKYNSNMLLNIAVITA